MVCGENVTSKVTFLTETVTFGVTSGGMRMESEAQDRQFRGEFAAELGA